MCALVLNLRLNVFLRLSIVLVASIKTLPLEKYDFSDELLSLGVCSDEKVRVEGREYLLHLRPSRGHEERMYSYQIKIRNFRDWKI